jgi:type I restriction enzyme R subunit
MIFNEDSRVKIPTILHLVRLGYEYLPLKGQKWDVATNIFTDLFQQSIQQLNPHFNAGDVKRLYDEVALSLENEDLGRAFYEKLVAQSGTRLIDLNHFNNNSFHVVTELTYKKEDMEFRPDITLLINGMPLVFIEVKKPNNQDGVLAEHRRIEKRFKNKKWRPFANITQLMVFSNNMPYDNRSTQPIEGAFYATAAYQKPVFNYFREEEAFDLDKILRMLPDDLETAILKDTNLVSIKSSEAFLTNKKPDSPTNQICTSLFQRERFAFLLQYGLVYVKENNGNLQKHIMRYPQLFATKAIVNTLEKGIKKGIIWHTQGSGKTALAYFSVKYLTDYFQAKGIVPKFYFIVDRLDLLIQAGKEFKSRDLVVHEIHSREAFSKEIQSKTVLHNHSGKAEITVVNIQKFENDPAVVSKKDYQLKIQRIYFLDEVHRSYNPKGSFLANLNESDPNAIKIGLTGTPLLGDDYNSKSLFGGYIHKYYYNASIADGYTLRLIREEIETQYKLTLQQTLEDILLLKGDADRKFIYAHPKFVEPMLDYIVQDFEKARITMNDNAIGGMVVCDSSEQARRMFEIFEAKYAPKTVVLPTLAMAAEPIMPYNALQKAERKVKTAALVLHDIDTRKTSVEQFKNGEMDLLFVYNMLLTGFDAPRLKKLYIGRVIKSHNLLQTLTRVNRTFKDFRYGYVVDFADIQKEFDQTNKAYFDELQAELGDEMEFYSHILKSTTEINAEIQEIKEVLFRFDTVNPEVFSQQMTQINDRNQLVNVVKVLNNARSLYNLIRVSGQYEMLEPLDFHKLAPLARAANERLTLINTKEALENQVDTQNLLNIALEDVIFAFVKVKEEEMVLADALKDILQKTRETLGGNWDPKDPVFVSLREELERLFKKKNLNEVSKAEMERNIKALQVIHNAAKELERNNLLLKAKYDNDAKYARLHKRLMEKNPLTNSEIKLFDALQGLKAAVDAQILQNVQLMHNETFVEKMMLRLVIQQLRNKYQLPLDAEQAKTIQSWMVKEYLTEFRGFAA